MAATAAAAATARARRREDGRRAAAARPLAGGPAGLAATAAVGKDSKGHCLTAFSPAVVYFKLSLCGRLKLTKPVPLVGTAGERISSLSNGDRDDTLLGANCTGAPLATDVGGIDAEDAAPFPGTSLLVVVVEEYSPSIVVVHGRTGVVHARYVPAR